ncbi:MAG: hypothetical protein Q7S96_00820 [bacterium]|nr:hypothetical protein [bacterium]
MVVSRFDGGTVFRGSGNSHVTFAGGGAHITTEVPNLRLGDDGTRELKDFLRTDVPLRGY